jgi:hypothetical protein
MAAEIKSSPAFEHFKPKALFRPILNCTNYDVTADGQHFILGLPPEGDDCGFRTAHGPPQLGCGAEEVKSAVFHLRSLWQNQLPKLSLNQCLDAIKTIGGRRQDFDAPALTSNLLLEGVSNIRSHGIILVKRIRNVPPNLASAFIWETTFA